MKLENMINHWDPWARDPEHGKPKGSVFILFALYVFQEYVTLDLFNFRFNFLRGAE